jgi:hypothetical protein
MSESKDTTNRGFMGDASIRKDEDCVHGQQASTFPTQTNKTREAFEEIAKSYDQHLNNFNFNGTTNDWSNDWHYTYSNVSTAYYFFKQGAKWQACAECTHEAKPQESHQAATYDETQSRNAFEAWSGKYCHLIRVQDGTYTNSITQAKWEGWREREAKRGLDLSITDYSVKLQQILESVFRQREETTHKHLYHGREIALFKAKFNRTLFALKFGDGN